jgi:hypothetical protein
MDQPSVELVLGLRVDGRLYLLGGEPVNCRCSLILHHSVCCPLSTTIEGWVI